MSSFTEVAWMHYRIANRSGAVNDRPGIASRTAELPFKPLGGSQTFFSFLAYMLALRFLVRHKGRMQMPTVGPILLAEDDENDVFFVKYAVSRSGLAQSVFAVPDGRQAINYLEGFLPYQDRLLHPFPSLVLLDLKMPIVNGFEVLAYCRARPHLRTLPILIISSSAQDADHARARNLGADDFIVKPTDFRELIPLLRRIDEKWLRTPLLTKESAVPRPRRLACLM
jgi:CheY-like chemotaxis protein